MEEIWMMSNRQPWVEALIKGLIKTKTRSNAVSLPPENAVVFLHASIALWQGWKELEWSKLLDVPNLPRGGIVGVGTVDYSRVDSSLMPENDWKYFYIKDWYGNDESVADEQCIVFKNIKSIPFIPCRGSQVPTRKLPRELLEAIKKNPRLLEGRQSPYKENNVA